MRMKKASVFLAILLFLFGCSRADEAPAEAPGERDPVERYDWNGDGFLATEEFPFPAGEAFDCPAEYIPVYDAVSAYYGGKLRAAAGTAETSYDLFLPSIRIPLSYEDEDGNRNYVLSVLICVYYDIGKFCAQFPEPVYWNTGGMGNLCRVIFSPEGVLLSVEESPDGAGNDWYYRFCGPYEEVAEALLGHTDTEIQYQYDMTKDFDELVRAYLSYYFDR